MTQISVFVDFVSVLPPQRAISVHISESQNACVQCERMHQDPGSPSSSIVLPMTV
jgi:hypothetical protein